MFYTYAYWYVFHLLGSRAIERQFFCYRCLRIMRIYAITGLSILGLIAATAIAATIWLTSSGS